MKKSACAAALLGLVGAASAQSSVTVFGIMAWAVRGTKNSSAGSLVSLVSGSNATSRWGLRGSEDLGGGNSASFWLEATVLGDTGGVGSTTLTNQIFNRRSTVSLANTSWGEIRLGRDYAPTHTILCTQGFDPFGCVGLANTAAFRNSTAAVIRNGFGTGDNSLIDVSNSAQYILPSNLGGLNGGVFVSGSEGLAPAVGNDKTLGGRIGYASGPFSASAALLDTKNVAPGRFRDLLVAASYDFGLLS
jgi:predicted porin